MIRYSLSISCLLILSSLIYSQSSGQISAERVLENMLERYENSIRDIDDFTVVTNLYTAYNKKTYVDGRPVFETKTEIRGLEGYGGASGAMFYEGELFDSETYDKLKIQARYEGREIVDGASVHALFIPEITQVEEKGKETMRNVRLYIDAEEWVMRRITYDGEFEQRPGDFKPIFTTIYMLDYRTVDGLLLPFKTVIELEGLEEVMTPEEKKEAQRNLDELERQMEAMPEEQRRMMEQMLKPQLEQLRRMLEGEKMEFTIIVEEVRVNTGI